MTDEDYKLEHELRALARERDATDACAILADFYEQRGQLSRAVLWRSRLAVLHAMPADQHMRRDPMARRDAMAWLLAHLLELKGVARVLRVNDQARLRWDVGNVEDKVHLAAAKECIHPTLAATQRLQAAGALPVLDRTQIGDQMLSDATAPESWPITDEIETQSRDERRARAERAGKA